VNLLRTVAAELSGCKNLSSSGIRSPIPWRWARYQTSRPYQAAQFLPWMSPWRDSMNACHRVI